jgi:O-antigen ligase
MKNNIDNILTVKKLPLLIAIITSMVIISMTSHFHDVTVSLYVLILGLIFTAFSIFIILYPLGGFIFIVIYKPFANLVELPMIHSGGRIVFIILAIGWFLKYLFQGKSVFFSLVRSNKIIIIFIFSMFFSSVFAFNPVPSFVKSLEITAYILMCFFIMQDVITNENKLKFLITVIALSTGIISLFGIIDYLAYGNITEYGTVYRMSGIYDNPNGLGQICLFGIPFIFFLSFNARSLIVKLLFILFFFTTFFSLGLALSRTFLIGFIVFILAYLLLAFKNNIIDMKKFLIALIIGAILSFLLFHFFIDNIIARVNIDISDDLRYYILLKGIHLLIEHPFVGVGFENFQHVLVSDVNLNNILSKYGGLHGHDIISKVFVSIGVIGSTILLIIFYTVLKNMHRASKNRSLQRDSYFFNFIVVLQAGYISLLSSGIGTGGMIFDVQLWIYYSLAVFVYRLGELRNMEYFAKISSLGLTNINNVADSSSVLRG